jgi:hypothetical protein
MTKTFLIFTGQMSGECVVHFRRTMNDVEIQDTES